MFYIVCTSSNLKSELTLSKQMTKSCKQTLSWDDSNIGWHVTCYAGLILRQMSLIYDTLTVFSWVFQMDNILQFFFNVKIFSKIERFLAQFTLRFFLKIVLKSLGTLLLALARPAAWTLSYLCTSLKSYLPASASEFYLFIWYLTVATSLPTICLGV